MAFDIKELKPFYVEHLFSRAKTYNYNDTVEGKFFVVNFCLKSRAHGRHQKFEFP